MMKVGDRFAAKASVFFYGEVIAIFTVAVAYQKYEIKEDDGKRYSWNVASLDYMLRAVNGVAVNQALWGAAVNPLVTKLKPYAGKIQPSDFLGMPEYIENFPESRGFTVVPKSVCVYFNAYNQHQLVPYVGLIETYEYCASCGEKKK